MGSLTVNLTMNLTVNPNTDRNELEYMSKVQA